MKGVVRMLLLSLCLCCLLSGCRTRTTGGQGEAAGDPSAGQGSGAAESSAPEAEEDGPGETAERSERTRENPDAPRKEYDENAAAELVPGTDRPLYGEGEGEGAPLAAEDAAESAARLNGEAEETARQIVAAPEAERMGVSEDAEEADSAMTYFTALLRDRLDSLYECQRANVYWETAEDHVTVFKTSPEHALILGAGAYDVSARLLRENLRVDDGWVARKDPGVIVKVVDSGVLGGGVFSTNAARAVRRELVAREGWAGIDAVRNGRVVLLSQELLAAPCLQTAAMLMIAKTASPALFADVDPDEALRMLMEEATGTLPSGVYCYAGKEE